MAVTSQEELTARYGGDSPWRRRALIATSALLALTFLGWLGWTTWVHATPEVASDLVGFEVLDEHTATAQVRIRLKDDTVAATCVLRAFAEDHTVVGEASFVPTYGAAQPVEATVRTERRATSVDLIGCTTPNELRPR